MYAADNAMMPTTPQNAADRNALQVKPMNSSAGVYTNMNGTSALPIDSRNAVRPVRIGSDPAMPAAA